MKKIPNQKVGKLRKRKMVYSLHQVSYVEVQLNKPLIWMSKQKMAPRYPMTSSSSAGRSGGQSRQSRCTRNHISSLLSCLLTPPPPGRVSPRRSVPRGRGPCSNATCPQAAPMSPISKLSWWVEMAVCTREEGGAL